MPENQNKKVILKPGREDSVKRHHPWIFSGAVKKVEGNPENGATVEIFSADGRWLASGAFSPKSQILVRVWSFLQEEAITPEFFKNRLKKAISLREQLFSASPTNAYRLINAESDGLPGLIVDRYSDYAVCQFLSAGAEFWKTTIVQHIMERLPLKGVFERSDEDVRLKEGLQPQKGVLAGETPPDLIEIQENSLRFRVDIQQGHKTGFYLDQRDNRDFLGRFANEKDVLNCFSYTGGFGIAALKGGAKSLINIDTSANALQIAQQNIELNGLHTKRAEQMTGDVFQILRRFRDEERQFDVIVLDPPKFAGSVNQVEKAARGYKDINWLAFRILRPGGILFTFSCSAHIKPPLFQKIVADAAVDAGRDARIIQFLSQASDHPIALNFPE
ncbi:class I SAM-dependent methyltransferase, partial [candidate division KSB1 bacterium]|nr:class I SAM-dependent methyltransferase [candidate division KSB1 bacterium]